jgi:uncharacterized protein DUF4265
MKVSCESPLIEEQGMHTLILNRNNDVPVEFPDERVTVGVPVTRVGENLYRLDAIPVGVEQAGYRDVIEAEPVEGGKLRFRRVTERSGWKTYDFIPSAGKIQSEWGQSLLRRLEELGGHWEVILGGLLFIPPGIDLDPTEWVFA